MKTIILVIFIGISCLTAKVFALEIQSQSLAVKKESVSQHQVSYKSIFLSKCNSEQAATDELKSDNGSRFERRGCCSHHSGVCGCSNGRAVCCDSTLSPSCGCD